MARTFLIGTKKLRSKKQNSADRRSLIDVESGFCVAMHMPHCCKWVQQAGGLSKTLRLEEIEAMPYSNRTIAFSQPQLYYLFGWETISARRGVDSNAAREARGLYCRNIVLHVLFDCRLGHARVASDAWSFRRNSR